MNIAHALTVIPIGVTLRKFVHVILSELLHLATVTIYVMTEICSPGYINTLKKIQNKIKFRLYRETFQYYFKLS